MLFDIIPDNSVSCHWALKGYLLITVTTLLVLLLKHVYDFFLSADIQGLMLRDVNIFRSQICVYVCVCMCMHITAKQGAFAFRSLEDIDLKPGSRKIRPISSRIICARQTRCLLI